MRVRLHTCMPIQIHNLNCEASGFYIEQQVLQQQKTVTLMIHADDLNLSLLAETSRALIGKAGHLKSVIHKHYKPEDEVYQSTLSNICNQLESGTAELNFHIRYIYSTALDLRCLISDIQCTSEAVELLC